jgi:hypothetical protein
VSKRSGTRTPPAKRAREAVEKRADAAGERSTDKGDVGARAFTRRARAERRRRSARHAASGTRTPAGFAERLVALDILWVLARLREALARIPRAALACALVAFLSAVCWSIVTPPFQVPDEPAHFAYVKQLAETGTLPVSHSGQYSYEEIATLDALHYYRVRQQPQDHTITSRREQALLNRTLRLAPRESENGSRAAGGAASSPPLYYALEAIPYTLARGGTLLTRMQLMRLFSALLAGLTAMFAFLFIREALPGEPWAWTVGGLAVALVPLLSLMSGAVNPDALLFAVSTAVFYCLARAFRRGLSTRGAAAIGALIAIGLLTQLSFIGLVPGVIVGLVALSVRAARTSGRSAYRLPALALGIGFAPAVLYGAVNAISGHALFGTLSDEANTLHGSLLGALNYIWQLYLPRLPGAVNDFPGLFTTRQLWFDGYVGLYGWLDTTFPGWVYSVALVPASAIALLFGRALYTMRAALRARAVELAVYASIAVSLMLFVGAASYHGFPGAEAEFGEARYLLPLIALLGAAIALAARGAGRRWGPAVGALLVVLFLAHDAFSQLLEVARFYG